MKVSLENEIENKEKNINFLLKKEKEDEEECLSYNKKYKTELKKEEEKIEKEKTSSTNSTSSQNENTNLNNNHFNYLKNNFLFKYDRKMSSPILCYYDGFDKYLSEKNSSYVDFNNNHNFINKETYFNNDYLKNYDVQFRNRSFGNINELNFNYFQNKNYNISNFNNINWDKNNQNDLLKFNNQFHLFGYLNNLESKIIII